jgi:site-specific DNA-methyltransferase (adenine-specific)
LLGGVSGALAFTVKLLKKKKGGVRGLLKIMKNEEIKDIAEKYYNENADWLNKNQEQDTKFGFRQGFAFALKSIDFDDLLKKYASEGNRMVKKKNDLIMDINKIYLGDCLDIMPLIPDKSIDMILCDLPYGTTQCKWDAIIPFNALWKEYKRIIKPNGAIVLFGREPFTSALIMSNVAQYKHKWVWNKKQSGSPINAKYMPLQLDEDIIVFAKGKVNYYPQMRKGKMRKRGGYKEGNNIMGKMQDGFENYSDEYFPTNIIEFANPRLNKKHPTEKPVEIMQMLINHYTKTGEKVLDNCIGSGTTAIACKRTNRNFIGIEMEQKYFDIANKRLNKELL